MNRVENVLAHYGLLDPGLVLAVAVTFPVVRYPGEMLTDLLPCRPTGRTHDSDSCNGGSNPPGASTV